jgi:hypothetical protein
VAQFADMAGRAADSDEVHAEREWVGRNCQAHWQSVVARRIRQEAVALEVLYKWLGRARVGDVDRSQQDPGQDLRAGTAYRIAASRYKPATPMSTYFRTRTSLIAVSSYDARDILG